MRTTPVKLTEADLESDGLDCVLPIEYPDGKRIQIVIPNFGPDHWTNYAYAKDKTFWLNLVCDDHYS